MSKAFKNALRVAELCAQGNPPFERETIHLCNWYVKLVRPGREIADDQFQCIVPMQMTKFDIRNYFEKIYNINVHKVDTRIQHGKMKPKHKGQLARKVKTPDFKVAYVTLADEKFTFPTTFEDFVTQRKEQVKQDLKKRDDDHEELLKHKKQYKSYVEDQGKAGDGIGL